MVELATVDDVLPYLPSRGVTSQRPEDTAFTSALIRACSTRLVNYIGRSFVPEPALVGEPPADVAAPVSKTFTVRRSRYVTVPDLRTVTSITLGGLTLVDGDGYELWGAPDQPTTTVKILGPMPPYRADLGGLGAYNQLVVTGRWGFLTVPEDLKDACAMWVARRFAQKDARYADTVQAGIEGAAFTYSKNMPMDIQMTADFYRQGSGPKVALI